MEQHAPHDHHSHGHTHSHEHHDVVTKRRLTSKAWSKFAEYGNYAVAAFQSAASILSGQAGAAIDGLHSGLDGAGYRKEGQNLHNTTLSEQQRLRNRKIIFWLFSSTSLVLGAKAGVEIALDDEPNPNMLTVYSAGVSVGLNALLFSGIYKGIRERRKTEPNQENRYTPDEKTQLRHFLGLDVPSSILSLVGAVGQYLHPSAGNTAGIISGVLGIWLFRPTEKNIRQECHHGPAPTHSGGKI